MPIVNILNRDYQIACGDGEEKKLLELSAKLDKRLKENARLFKGANESLLIILTALTLEDYTQDLESQLSQVSTNGNKALDKTLDELTARIDRLTKII